MESCFGSPIVADLLWAIAHWHLTHIGNYIALTSMPDVLLDRYESFLYVQPHAYIVVLSRWPDRRIHQKLSVYDQVSRSGEGHYAAEQHPTARRPVPGSRSRLPATLKA